jgi:hypothetical protein
MNLTKEIIENIKKDYPNKKNASIALKNAVSIYDVRRVAKKYNLKKNEEFMQKCRMEANRISANVIKNLSPEEKKDRIRAASLSPKYQTFKKGQWVHANKTPEQISAMYKNIAEKRAETLKKEKTRVRFGLEQRTKIKLAAFDSIKENKRTYAIRYYLKKRGYDVKGFSVKTKKDTIRGIKAEKNAIKHGFILQIV